jgi:hypothetical protein
MVAGQAAGGEHVQQLNKGSLSQVAGCTWFKKSCFLLCQQVALSHFKWQPGLKRS